MSANGLKSKGKGRDDMTITTRVVVHVLLFLLAIVVFYVGLGTGLQVSPALGTGLWIAAGAIAVFNTIWIFWALRQRSG